MPQPVVVGLRRISFRSRERVDRVRDSEWMSLGDERREPLREIDGNSLSKHGTLY
jgi:hypothetical protein